MLKSMFMLPSEITAPDKQQTRLPLLSFVVLNHNYGRFLSTCVQSIMTQSYSNIECIVIDNASTDNSREIINNLLQSYPAIRTIYNQENLGQSDACIAGLKIAKGAYVAFIDADDFLLPDYAGTHIRAHLTLAAPVAFSSGGMVQLSGDSVVVPHCTDSGDIQANSWPVPAKEIYDIRDLRNALGTDELESPKFLADLRWVNKKVHGWVWSPTSGNVYRRDALALLADNPRLHTLRLAADAYFNYALHALSGSVRIERPLAVYRIHGKNQFTMNASMRGILNFRKSDDDARLAAFLALEHLVANIRTLGLRVISPRVLYTALEAIESIARKRTATILEAIALKAIELRFAFSIFRLGRRLRRKKTNWPSTESSNPVPSNRDVIDEPRRPEPSRN